MFGLGDKKISTDGVEEKTAIIFPDFQGKAVQDKSDNGFISRVRRTMPQAILVPILNGLPETDLIFFKNEASLMGMGPVVSTDPRELLGALIIGYQYVIQLTAGPIVRLDIIEHPPEEIPRLLAEAEKNSGMVIGDLDFSTGGLKSDSVDEFAHLDLFPALYRQVTKGKLELSCAHGFQVFSGARECKATLEKALEIIEEMEREISKPVTWGFDGAMALGAVAANIPVNVMKVAAETVRNRSRKKVASQFEESLHICRAATRLYRW